MIVLGLILAMFGWAVVIGLFLVWTVRNAILAKKYKESVKTESVPSPESSVPRWSISYKINGTVRSVIIVANTEQEALGIYCKNGGNPRGVVSTDRV